MLQDETHFALNNASFCFFLQIVFPKIPPKFLEKIRESRAKAEVQLKTRSWMDYNLPSYDDIDEEFTVT